MELNLGLKKIKEYVCRYKYVVLIIILGVIMLLIPVGGNTSDNQKETEVLDANALSFEDRLRNILSCVNGAGRVEVMLSILEGEEVIYQADENNTKGNNTETSNKKIIIMTDSERNENGLTKQKNPPTYKGVIIVCDGAEDPVVRLNMITAVSKLTGLGADKISVLKMK